MPFDYSNAGLTPQPSKSLGKGSVDTSAGDYSSTMTIVELTAPTGAQPRTVTLQGPSLPFMGAKWGFENALVTTWYPGNGDEASQQNLGPKEMPSTWTGEWNRTLMGKTPTQVTDDQGGSQVIVAPFVLYQFLEDILRAGQRIRVTWSVASEDSDSRGKIIREGRCRSFQITATRIQDLEWEATFEWQSRGQRVQRVADAVLGNLSAQAAQLQLSLANMASVASAQAFISENAAIPGSASNITLGQLENFANAPTTLVRNLGISFEKVQTQLEQVADIAATLESQPTQVVSSAVNIAKNAIAIGNQAIDELGQVPFEGMSQSTGIADLLRSYRYFGQSSDAMLASITAAQSLNAQMQARAPTPAGAGALSPQSAQAQAGDLIAAYVTKDGDTPQRISQRFYNSPDHAADIMQANRLPWGQARFPKGQVLFIPTLRQQQPSV